MSSQQYALDEDKAKEEIELHRAVEEIAEDMRMVAVPMETLHFIAMGAFRSRSEELDNLIHYWRNMKTAELAAAKLLAEAGEWDLKVLAKYAGTGYQRFMMDSNPLVACVSKNYKGGPLENSDIDLPKILAYLREAPINQLRRLNEAFWWYALPDGRFTTKGAGPTASPTAEVVAKAVRQTIKDEGHKFARLKNQMPGEIPAAMEEIFNCPN